MPNAITLNLTATQTEQLVSRTCYSIKLLKNDGDYDLWIGLDKLSTDPEAILLKKGEYFEDWDIDIFSKIYYRSVGGNVNFRLYSKVV